MRKIYFLVGMVLASVGVWGQTNHLVISQVYGGGGNASATYNKDFIELFNPTGSSISLTGWSVQYASATGSTWTVSQLTGTIAPGKYYLIEEQGGATGAALPTPDVVPTTNFNMSASAGKVALCNSTIALTGTCPTGGSIIDFIGFGATANCSETAVATAPSNNTTSIQRAGSGCTDANNNSTDFAVLSVSPRNSATAANYCYPTKFVITSISPTSPTAGVGFDVTIQAQNAGNLAQNVIATTAFSLTTNGAAGTIGGTTTGSITAGGNSVTVTGVTLSASGTGVTLTATRTSGDNLAAGTSATFTVLAGGGTPTKFAITGITPASPTAGKGFNITVQSLDNSDIPQNVTANTSFSLTTNGAAGTIGGTTTGTILAGTSSILVSGVTLSTAGTGATLTATQTAGDVLSAGTSATFNVLEAASQLAFVAVPTSGSTIAPLSSFTVEARRPDNSVDNTYTGTITVSKASGPGTLSGTTAVAALAGVATFSTLQFDQPGSYTLDANATGLTVATSGSITITQPPVIWNFGTGSGTASPTSGIPVTNLTIGDVSQGNNNGTTTMVTNGSASSGYSGASGNYNAGAASFVGAINTSSSTYFEFTLTPATGYNVTLNAISFGSRSTSTGPAAFSVRSNLDGYVADVATGVLSTSATWALSSPATTATSSLGGTAITFRIYGHSGAGSPSLGTANWRIDDLNISVSVSPVPTITSFTPTSGYTGNSVVITGTNFTGATAVKFGGTNAASFIVDNATQITATVGAGATGLVSVSTTNGTGLSAGTFTYNGYITSAAGNWSSGATWLGGNVPPSGANVTLAHNVAYDVSATVNNLALSGGIIPLGANNLTVQGSLTGGSSANYFVTDGAGTLTINGLGTGKSNVVFPVGPGASLYHPVTIDNIGTTDNFSVNLSSASAPACLPSSNSVTETWNISEGTPGGSNCTLTFDYTGAAEGASYTSSGAQIAHCAGASVDYHNGSVTGSVATGSGFTSFSPFGITVDNVVLPVKFGNVKAYQQGTAIKVEWSNLTETNVADYKVERSGDGQSFSVLGTVSPRSNNGGRADYTYLDANPVNGVNFYRIQSLEQDGKKLYSVIVRVSTKGGKTEITVYPNPATGNQVSFQATSLPKGQYTLSIIGTNGQRVYSQSLVHAGGALTENIQLPSTVAPGIYNLQLAGPAIKLTKTIILQ